MLHREIQMPTVEITTNDKQITYTRMLKLTSIYPNYEYLLSSLSHKKQQGIQNFSRTHTNVMSATQRKKASCSFPGFPPCVVSWFLSVP